MAGRGWRPKEGECDVIAHKMRGVCSRRVGGGRGVGSRQRGETAVWFSLRWTAIHILPALKAGCSYSEAVKPIMFSSSLYLLCEEHLMYIKSLNS